MKKVELNWTELEFAFGNSSYEIDFYLDTETGEVLSVSDEARSILRRLHDQYGNAAETGAFDLPEALNRSGIPDWQQQEVTEAQQIGEDSNFRYLEIPKRSSHEDYQIMRDFIITVEDERLGDLLWEATDGRGAFRFFKSVLSDYPDELERWYAYHDNRLMEELLEWLEMADIEPTNMST